MTTPPTDMSKLIAHYRALLEPAGSGRDVAYRRDEHIAQHADDAHAFLPGTWFMAGHHHGGESVRKMWETVRLMWPEGTRLFRNHFFVGEDTIAVEWWSRNRMWNGNACCNSGVGRMRFRGEEVIDHYEITDSEYFEEVHGDWRGFLDPDLGQHLPLYGQRDRPFYPDPDQNDWALDHSPTDGQKQAPEAMQERLARAIKCWNAPNRGDTSLFSDESLFSDDVDVFFQGRLWPLGGHHRGRAALERLREVADAIWPGSRRIVKTNFWADESRVLVEWFREAHTFKGQPFRDGGFTVWDWSGDRVSAVRSYVDTSLHAELLTGWREHLGEHLGSALPNWPVPSEPRYPETDAHE